MHFVSAIFIHSLSTPAAPPRRRYLSWQPDLVFKANGHVVGSIREMLRALVITYEDPTAAELALLTGLVSDAQRLELLEVIETCRPLVS